MGSGGLLWVKGDKQAEQLNTMHDCFGFFVDVANAIESITRKNKGYEYGLYNAPLSMLDFLK